VCETRRHVVRHDGFPDFFPPKLKRRHFGTIQKGELLKFPNCLDIGRKFTLSLFTASTATTKTLFFSFLAVFVVKGRTKTSHVMPRSPRSGKNACLFLCTPSHSICCYQTTEKKENLLYICESLYVCLCACLFVPSLYKCTPFIQSDPYLSKS